MPGEILLGIRLRTGRPSLSERRAPACSSASEGRWKPASRRKNFLVGNTRSESSAVRAALLRSENPEFSFLRFNRHWCVISPDYGWDINKWAICAGRRSWEARNGATRKHFKAKRVSDLTSVSNRKTERHLCYKAPILEISKELAVNAKHHQISQMLKALLNRVTLALLRWTAVQSNAGHRGTPAVPSFRKVRKLEYGAEQIQTDSANPGRPVLSRP